MPRPLMLALALCLALVGCDDEPGPAPFDPDSVDFDEVESLDYGDYVQPLLAARNVFAPAATDDAGDPADYEWADLFGEAHDHGDAHEHGAMTPGETIVPFDAEGSLLVRFVEDLGDDVEIPFPNLRNLQDDEVRYLKRWIEDGAKSDGGDVPYADAEHLLYAAVQGANYVAVLDATRRQVIRNIYFEDHGFTCEPNGPHYMVFEPDRSAVYVSLVNCNAVAKISGSLAMDPSDPAYLFGVARDFTTPGMMVLDPDRDRLYVGRSTASTPGTTPTVGVFSSGDLSAIEEFAIPDPGTSFPHAIAMTPDFNYILTAPLNGDYALSMDALTGDLVSRVPVGGVAELVHFSMLPDGETATLTANPAGAGEDKVLFFSVADDGTIALTGEVATGGERAWHAHLDSDGVTVMVPNRASNSISLIDVPSQTLRMEVENEEGGPLVQPHSPGPQHDGAFFVSNSNLNGAWTPPYPFLGADGEPLPNDASGNVVALDPDTGEILKVILLGHYPSGLEHWHAGGHMHGGGAHGGHGGHDH
jgi:DNA-binding beta-propeller fold protein YncE